MGTMISAYGRLGQDPRKIETRSEKAMAVASLAVEIEERDADNPAPLWLGIVTFGRRADDLMRHAKGDLLSVSGRIQRNRYQARDGQEREQLQVVADSIVSARTVRPKGGRKRPEKATERDGQSPLPRQDADAPVSDSDLNDPLPF